MDTQSREPVKPFIGTSAMFKALLENSPRGVGNFKGVKASNYLKNLCNTKFDWLHLRPKPTQTGYFNQKKSRYIYTKKGGWIDMVHFMFYAGKAYKYKLDKQQALEQIKKPSFGRMRDGTQSIIINTAKQDPIGEAIQDGYMQEASDYVVSKHSAYSYEDLPSDKFGAQFAVNYFNPKSNLTLGEQLENYLNNVLDATNPTDAPNYNQLPTEDSRNTPSRTNKTTTPIYTKDNP